jgi:hypothetical protein
MRIFRTTARAAIFAALPPTAAAAEINGEVTEDRRERRKDNRKHGPAKSQGYCNASAGGGRR